ncbi:MAG TPA: sugar ABC transporter substrate-binding protein [Cellulomonas sp.]
MRTNRSRRLMAVGGLTIAAGLVLAGCTSGSDTGAPQVSPSTGASADGGQVKLSFTSWDPNMDKIVDVWNKANPDIQVELVSPSESGDELVTKWIAQNKAGTNPDVVKVEYQNLPNLIANGVIVPLDQYVPDLASKYDAASIAQVKFQDKVYGAPQDFAPLVFFYRQDVFDKLGLKAPATWDEYAADAKKIHDANPSQFIGTISSADPGWFAGLAQQAGGNWWSTSGDSWQVNINDAGSKKVADFWTTLYQQGVVEGTPFWSTDWNAQMDNGTLVGWVSAAWAPAQLPNIAADTAGKWTAAPLPAWTPGDTTTGVWGGSAVAVSSNSKHPAQAAKFVEWLNTSDEALKMQISTINVYPAATAGRSLPELDQPPAFMKNQPDYYKLIGQIAPHARSFDIWGPNAAVTFGAYRDGFAGALQNKTALSAALDTMQSTTVTDMTKRGFNVAK